MSNLGVVYFGSKLTLAPLIVQHIPSHKIWVDAFFGGGSVTFAKSPKISETEIINDAGYCVNFFRVLRDYPDDLIRSLSLTPMAEDEWRYAHDHWKWEENPVEQARLWYTQVMQCFSHEENGVGWIGVGKKVSQGKSWTNHVRNLDRMVERLRTIQIFNRKVSELFSMLDDETTCWYFDPPYMGDSRTETGNYRIEMSKQEHQELIDFCLSSRGQVMISGYWSQLYESAFSKWKLVTRTRRSGIHNNEQIPVGDGVRTEHLWIKEHARKTVHVMKGLFDDLSENET